MWTSLTYGQEDNNYKPVACRTNIRQSVKYTGSSVWNSIPLTQTTSILLQFYGYWCDKRLAYNYYLLVRRSRTSTSQQCAFASVGPLLWNCFPVKTSAQILSSSLSPTPRLLKSFLFPGAYSPFTTLPQYPVNLALLHHFFENDTLGALSGDTLLTQPLSVQLSPMKFFNPSTTNWPLHTTLAIS